MATVAEADLDFSGSGKFREQELTDGGGARREHKSAIRTLSPQPFRVPPRTVCTPHVLCSGALPFRPALSHLATPFVPAPVLVLPNKMLVSLEPDTPVRLAPDPASSPAPVPVKSNFYNSARPPMASPAPLDLASVVAAARRPASVSPTARNPALAP